MFVITPLVILILALSAGGVVAVGNSLEENAAESAQNAAAETEDQVAASFERELNHQPVDIPPTNGEVIENDGLHAEVNSALWTIEPDDADRVADD